MSRSLQSWHDDQDRYEYHRRRRALRRRMLRREWWWTVATYTLIALAGCTVWLAIWRLVQIPTGDAP